MKCLKIFIFIVLPLGIISCAPDSVPLTPEQETGKKSIELICESIQTPKSDNRFAVYVIIDENKVKIAELDNCININTKDFSDKHIPKDALVAVEGNQEIIYASLEAEKIIFLAGKKELNQDGVPEYYPLVTYEFGKYYFKIPLSKEDLVGTYAAETVDQSWILFIGMREQGLEAQFFEINGPLPDKKILARLLPVIPVMDLKNLEIDLKDQRIRSELGPGFFYSSNDQLEIIFTDFEQHPSGKLRLKPIQ